MSGHLIYIFMKRGLNMFLIAPLATFMCMEKKFHYIKMTMSVISCVLLNSYIFISTS